jgi:hypothetical protein
VRPRPARLILLCALLGCATADPGRHLETELGFLRAGVRIEDEEHEVRRVLRQRGLTIRARLEAPLFVALGAATRGGEQSAVRIITGRGVVYGEDGSHQDLFRPGGVSLIEHFGGSVGEYLLAATARVAVGRDLGCVTLHRILPDGRVVDAELDLSHFGSLACVANVAPGRAGRIRATIAWPDLHALKTPSLEVELEFVETPLGKQAPLAPRLKLMSSGELVEQERTRLSTVRLARAPFSERHGVGVARAALGALTGSDRAAQIASYRDAVHVVPPGSSEAEMVAFTVAHIGRGWREPGDETPEEAAREAEEGAPDDAIVIEPATPAEVPEDDVLIIEPEPAAPPDAR